MEPENIEFNGVEYEVKNLIQFSSLARLLLDLTKRQKILENKYESINESILGKDNKASNIEIKVLGQSKSSQKNIVKDIISNDSNSQRNESPNISNDYIKKQKSFEGENSKKIKEEEEKAKMNEEIKDFSNENKINTDIITKIFKKLSELEKNFSQLNIKAQNDITPKVKTNQDNIKSNKSRLDELDKNYEEINKKLIKFNEEFDKIKVKVEDFNIYDILKSESGDGANLDATKALVMNLENKVFKKFEL